MVRGIARAAVGTGEGRRKAGEVRSNCGDLNRQAEGLGRSLLHDHILIVGIRRGCIQQHVQTDSDPGVVAQPRRLCHNTQHRGPPSSHTERTLTSLGRGLLHAPAAQSPQHTGEAQERLRAMIHGRTGGHGPTRRSILNDSYFQ